MPTEHAGAEAAADTAARCRTPASERKTRAAERAIQEDGVLAHEHGLFFTEKWAGNGRGVSRA